MLHKTKTAAILMIVLFFSVFTASSFAHCDSENGPTAVDARKALEKENFEIAAKWVGEKRTEELRNTFEEALEVYQMGGKAEELAEKHFVSTTVRLHREAEGMSFTGMKPAQKLPPVLAAAEKSLETGNLEPVTDLLSKELKKETGKWFKKAIAAKKNYEGDNLQAGRKWVDAYVKYVIFVNGIHKTIREGPAHGVGE